MTEFEEMFNQLASARLRYEILRADGDSFAEIVEARHQLHGLRAAMAQLRPTETV